MAKTNNSDPIRKAENGTYYFRANLGYDDKGKKIQKHRSGFKTKKEAKEAYAKILIQGKEHIIESKTESMTFKQFVDEIFLPWRKANIDKNTYVPQERILKTKDFDCFNLMEIGKIKALDVQEWQAKLSKRLKNNSVRKIQTILSLVFDRAMILGLCSENPSRKVGCLKSEKSDITFWTKEEFDKAVSTFNLNDYYERCMFTGIWLLFMTGMRSGEMNALTWEDVDLDKGILIVNKSLTMMSYDDIRIKETKTENSNRSITLDEHTISLLKQWKLIQSKVVKSEYVIAYNEIPIHRENIRKALEKCAREANVNRITIHGLRHSHASLLINLGENALVIKDRLGHADVKITLGTYGHLYPNVNHEVAYKLKEALSDKLISKITGIA